MNNWNYEELGFRSQKEMEESIKRVQEKKNLNNLELRAYNKAKFDTMTVNGGLDFKSVEEGARLEQLDKVVFNKLYWDKEEARRKAEQKEVSDLMSKVSNNIEAEKEAEAQRELRKAKAKAEVQLQKEIYSKHNVKTDKEEETDQLLGNMLKGLKL